MRCSLCALLFLISPLAIAAAPVVSIITPAGNSQFASPSNISISANASNAAGATITKVEFYRGTTLIGTDTTAPYSVTWNNATNGSYNITAKATNSAKQTTTSAPVTILVNNPPVVSLTAPANNTTVAGIAVVNLTATASDSGGSITKVEFFRDGTLIGSDTTSPYSFSWSNVVPGSYSITARATDNLGSTTSTSPVSLIVTNPLNVSFTAPANNAVFTQGIAIGLSASASTSKAGTTIARVDFYQGNTLIASDTSAPWNFSWTNAPAGTYSLTAKVIDSQGLSQTSAPVNIEVKAPGMPPSVSITSPLDQTRFLAPASISFTANASVNTALAAKTIATAAGPGPSISKVEYFQGTSLIGTATTAPYGFSWNNVAIGNYTITAKATDSQGLSQTSSPIHIQVNTLPSVSITAPVPNASFVAPATIIFSATASAAGTNNSISQVAYYEGSNLLGTASAPPFSFTWSSVVAGNYSVTAKATDTLGLSQSSSPLSLQVKALPTISISNPLDGAKFVAPASISLSSNPVAIGAGNSITQVEYFQGETRIAIATAAPFNANWNNVAAGNYSISAKTTDSFGNTNYSSPVAINVADRSLSLIADPAFATAPATINFTATSNLPSDNIAKIEILDGSTVLATLNTVPYTFTWSNLPAGNWRIQARLTDTANNVINSADVPVSVGVDNAKVYDIHTDHLGTPRLVSDANGNSVWEWNATPFGETAPNQNPGNSGAANDFVLNLRLPGQVFDQETGLHYNYYRDYDPLIGRYLQSDPIGLAGGVNTYGYVNGNPVLFFDFFGLDPYVDYRDPVTAGTLAIKDINPTSIREGFEYAGRICMTKDNKCFYTPPNKGRRSSSDPKSCPEGSYSVGTYHTHGNTKNDTIRGTSERFSRGDKYLNDYEGGFGFLGTPSGNIMLYIPDPANPGKGTITIIGTTKK